MGDYLDDRGYTVTSPDRTRTLFGQTMGYVHARGAWAGLRGLAGVGGG